MKQVSSVKTTGRQGRHYFLGGGIASLAGAALLLRGGQASGRDLCIVKQSGGLGGSLDGSGDVQAGFLVRGDRVFEEHFVCTFALFDGISSFDDPDCSVSDEFWAFNRDYVSGSHSRKRCNAPDRHALDLGWKDRLALVRLTLAGERKLEGKTIDSWFRQEFFDSSF